MLAGGCWLRSGSTTWPSVIDMASLDLRYVREEDNEFVIGAMATQGDVERFEPLQQFWAGAVVKKRMLRKFLAFNSEYCYYGRICSKSLRPIRHHSCINGSTFRHRYF